MTLKEHAEYELQRAGLFDSDSDYSGKLGVCVMEIVEVFSKQGHSGASAAMVVELASRLLRYEALTPITSDPDEWVDVSEQAGAQLWQNRRDSQHFSRDGGKTWYHLHDPESNNGDTPTGYRWRETYLGDDSLKMGVTLRVKPDAYEGHSGDLHNGKIGKFIGARNGYIYIQYEEATAGAGAPHSAEKVEIAT